MNTQQLAMRRRPRLNAEGLPYEEVFCWLCHSGMNYYDPSVRWVRFASDRGIYAENCETVVCSRPECAAWADERDRMFGRPTQTNCDKGWFPLPDDQVD
jgi:hypothetical protein